MDDSCVEAYAVKHGLRMVADTIKGHRTETARQFASGETIVSIPPLYAFPVRKDEDAADADGKVEEPTRCTHCFQPLPARHPRCSQCRSAQYCSVRCLDKHWKLRHYLECTAADDKADEAAAKVKPEHRPSLRMALGVATALAVPRRPRWLQVQASAWTRLVSHRPDHPPHVLRQYTQIASVLAQTASMDPETAVEALCRFGCNNFAAYDYAARTATGRMCSPLVALLFNHSCLPNASFVYSASEGKQVVRALHELAEGEEITLAYVDGMHPRSVRRRTLAEVYFFDCTCTRCEGSSERGKIDAMLDRDAGTALPLGLPTDYGARSAALDPWAMAVVRGLMETERESDLDRVLFDAVCAEQPCDVSFTAYTHWRECQDECLEKVTETPVLWPWACVASLYVLAFYALAYPPNHPMLATQCLEAAKIVWNSLQVSDQSPPGIDESMVKGLVRTARKALNVSTDSTVLAKQIDLLLDQLNHD